MGNTQSGVTSGVKNQINSGSCEIYKWANGVGGGELITIANKIRLSGTNDYSQLDDIIMTEIPRFLYNKGEGKAMSILSVINQRHVERTGVALTKPTINSRHNNPGVWKWMQISCIKDRIEQFFNRSLFNRFNHSIEPERKETVVSTQLHSINSATHKLVCWDLKQRGSVGETLLHVCFLCGSDDHMIVAERLLAHFPKLVNDFYLGDDYYGETALHMAIVNEDPRCVRILLEYNPDVHQRCCGNFFTADDQKSTRHDIWDVEHVNLSLNTNYKGRIYWGEYPLSFAACLEQDISLRMLISKGADPDRQDANGNTVLHILVIQRKPRMFDLCVSFGAHLRIKNRQGLTPLTLAAKLAHNEMYELILMKERELCWTYGDAVSYGYPLQDVDSIQPGTGMISTNSVLTMVVYGQSDGHLALLDGVLEELLKKKWSTFAKKRLFMQLTQFLIYFVFTLGAAILRPTIWTYFVIGAANETAIDAVNDTFYELVQGMNSTNTSNKDNSVSFCHLLKYNHWHDVIRFVCEISCALGAFWFLYRSCMQIQYVGWRLFIRSLTGFPAKALFLMSCMLVMTMLPLRVLCWSSIEDVVCILAILLNACQFLFFCRGFKLSGPFVLMIYKIIARDLFRFFLIYSIFVAGFSQAFYIIFLGYKRSRKYRDSNETTEQTIMSSLFESFTRMFLFSLNEFGVLYEQLQLCDLAGVAKILFMIYGLIISILLINMLIAMMGNTYMLIAESKKEWIRQWAAIILMLEQGVDPERRAQLQRIYSSPMARDSGQRALVITRKLTEEEIKVKKENREKRYKQFNEDKKKVNNFAKEEELYSERVERATSQLARLLDSKSTCSSPTLTSLS